MSDRYLIPSLMRAFEVLDLLSHAPRGLTQAELSRQTDIPKSTLFRILVSLQKIRCVVESADGKRYLLGSHLWELGSRFLDRFDIHAASAWHMESLAQESGETVFLGMMEEGQVVYMRRMESPKSVTIVKSLGQRVPAHCTATGVAMLAFLPPGEIDAIIKEHGLAAFNASTITTPERLHRRLADVRKRGVAIVNGEYNADLLCISAPVFNHTGRPVVSLTVAMLSSQADPEHTNRVSDMVNRAAQNFSKELGYLEKKVA